jgi:hypothetical protein
MMGGGSRLYVHRLRRVVHWRPRLSFIFSPPSHRPGIAFERDYGWFTEGFDTSDLKKAKALLEGLIEGAS